MTVKNIETILLEVQKRHSNFREAEVLYNSETDANKKSEHKQEANKKREHLFGYVKKFEIEGSPEFTEVGQFSDWEKYVEALIARLTGAETAEQRRIKKEESSKQRLKEKRNLDLRSELLSFLQLCETHEEIKKYRKQQNCKRRPNK